MTLMTLLCTTAACKDAPVRNAKARTVKAALAEFDPDDLTLDLDKWGTDRVDEWAVQEAFNGSFEGIDACVLETKQRLGLDDGAMLEGTVDFAVQLNPAAPRPLAVNANLSSERWNSDRTLKDCLREAVAGVQFPTYDGPPQVAEFSVDPLDLGGE